MSPEMRLRYHVYRDGKSDLQVHLKAALADFYARHRRLPAEIVVARTQAEQAQTALAALDLPRLPMRGCGGCLLGEVWLG